MQILNTAFPGVKILCFDTKYDSRGAMEITLDTAGLSAHGISFSCAEQRIYHIPRKGSFFGIHFQMGSHPQDKLIRLLSGRGMDYVIDLRRSSETYRKWISIELSGKNNMAVYIPQGYGHAFISLDDNTTQLFSASEGFSHGESKAIRFDDPQIGLSLPMEITAISERDKNAPLLRELEAGI